MEHFQNVLADFDGDVTMEYLEDSMQLLAIQGPGATTAIAAIITFRYWFDAHALHDRL